MSSHIDVDGDCPLAVVPCKYCDIGCKLKVLGLLRIFLDYYLATPERFRKTQKSRCYFCRYNLSTVSKRSKIKTEYLVVP